MYVHFGHLHFTFSFFFFTKDISKSSVSIGGSEDRDWVTLYGSWYSLGRFSHLLHCSHEKKKKKVCQVCTRFTKGCLLSTSHIVYTSLVYSTFVFTAAVLGKQKFMLSFHSVLNQCIRKCEMSVRKLVPASHCVLLN